MKSSHLLAMTAAALLATGSTFAGPNCKGSCPSDGVGEDVYEVVEREDGQAKEGKRERGERGERGERKRHRPMKELGLTEAQQEAAKEIMTAAREETKELFASLKEKKEAGEEIDRKSVREQVRAIRKGAMDKVYETVLNDEQRAKVDKRRAEMEKRRAEMEKRRAERKERGEGKDGERPERPRRGKDKRGDKGLDL